MKNIFLLSDNAIHWNIVPAAIGKNVFKELWGETSTRKFLEIVKNYFSESNPVIDWTVVDAGIQEDYIEKITPVDNSVNHAFATWKQYNDGKNKPWRVQEIVHVGQSYHPELGDSIINKIVEADLVIFQDWGMDIRNLKIPNLSAVLTDKWILYRSFSPLFEGNLWEEFQKSAGNKSIIVIRADDLRKLNTSISKGLSWEQTIQDIINEIYFKRNINLHPLRSIEYIIISFGSTGSLLIHNPVNNNNQKLEIKLFFDSMGNEGYWERAHPGYLPGDLELLISLISKEILFPYNGIDIDFDQAIRAHLLARRAMSLEGANVSEGSLPLKIIPIEICKIYGSKKTHEFSPVSLEYSLFESYCQDNIIGKAYEHKDWSLLGMTKWDLYSLARQIALFGPMKALQSWNIPIAKYNFLLTVDRKEIEFLHHLKSLITEYLLNKNNQPLSIAVFGSPGSGKSFSIKQLAKALDLPDQEIKDITFNLSQFNEDNPTDLYQAFHAVRDISLSGKTPLVFWDEFDSKNLAWLRYFLAPMQDGEFQEGQLTHNIGKSIFVFAGGTCSSMEEFELKGQVKVSEKGPDFLSRIKGFINVMGPNPVLPYAFQKSDCETVDGVTLMNLAKNTDPEYIIRRAILVNSLLQIGYRHLFANGVLHIDDGVLNALLLVPKYKHGTRSMETIFKTSQLFGKEKYHRSDLPPESQMNLHVDGQQFYELISQKPKYFEGGEAFYHLVNDITLDEHIVEKMAVGIHTIYSLVFSIVKDRHPLSITKEEFHANYEQMKNLPDDMPLDEVSQNYHNARKIPEKLAAVGFMIVPLDAKTQADFLDKQEFEKISQLEHIRWVRHHIDSGWSYSSVKNKPNKQHDALVAWDEGERKIAEAVYGKCYIQKMGLAEGELLSEHYRNLDRVITHAIPWILENVGYKIIKLKE
ncbi:MAG: hypothetical protein Q7U53_17955 [Anaerolineaceae bacterium]|nr:hypothetical protein [Anaerolineaceae bacterium]